MVGLGVWVGVAVRVFVPVGKGVSGGGMDVGGSWTNAGPVKEKSSTQTMVGTVATAVVRIWAVTALRGAIAGFVEKDR